jgi:type II secretion system protein J
MNMAMTKTPAAETGRRALAAPVSLYVGLVAGGRPEACPASGFAGGGRLVSAKRGFTLLEILIAVVVFSIVLAAINTVFFGALRLRNKAVESIEAGLPLQRALAVIHRDLANLVVPGGTLSGVLQTTSTTNLIAGLSSPSFYSSTGVIDETSPWAEIQRISYLLVESTNRTGGRELVRAVTRNLLPGTAEELPAEQWLMSGVDGIAFSYYDGTQWRDAWDSTTADQTTGQTNNLPRAIKVQIQLASEQGGRAAPTVAPIELVVPILVQARTNQTQQAAGGGQ